MLPYGPRRPGPLAAADARALPAPAPAPAPTPAPTDALGRVRDAIDDLDERVALLLAERARLSRQAALAKALAHAEHRNVARESAVRLHYKGVLCRSGWTEAQVDGLADALFDVAGGAPDLRIAIQGGPGSWSEESLLSLLPTARVLPCATVSDAWCRVRQGRAVAAWLAERNTLVGDIPDTRAARQEGEAWGQLTYPVRHALLAPAGVALEDVARVEGHPLALAQCRRTLDRVLPRAARVGTVDGAHAAHRVGPADRTAVVASARVAEATGLRVLVPLLADSEANATTFALVVPRP